MKISIKNLIYKANLAIFIYVVGLILTVGIGLGFLFFLKPNIQLITNTLLLDGSLLMEYLLLVVFTLVFSLYVFRITMYFADLIIKKIRVVN